MVPAAQTAKLERTKNDVGPSNALAATRENAGAGAEKDASERKGHGVPGPGEQVGLGVEGVVVNEGSQAEVDHDESRQQGNDFAPGPARSEVDEHGADGGEVQPVWMGHDTGEDGEEQKEIGGH
jgi:hypothetical protein